MGSSRIVNNVGVGKVEGTFDNLTTTGSAATQQPFTVALLDAQRVACRLIGDNEIGYLTTTHPVFGAVLALSEDYRSTAPAQLARATVQLAGVADMQGSTGTVGVSARPDYFVAGHNGFLTMFTTSNVERCHTTRGMIINVYDTDRVNVLF